MNEEMIGKFLRQVEHICGHVWPIYSIADSEVIVVTLKLSNKGNNKITELRTILQRESKNSELYKQIKSVNNRKTVKTVIST